MDFSEKLKEIRSKKGISQEELAAKIGVSRQAVTKWETGKGLPDIENMMILAEIFKTTLDELVSQQLVASDEKTYESETIYDIDCNKHFDIKLGNANKIYLSNGNDEKLHIKLESKKLENISSIFKIKLDERKNKLDVRCVNKDKMSKFEAEDLVAIKISLPNKYSNHCEINAQTKELMISDLNINHLEYDGPASIINIKNSSGYLEFTSKMDYEFNVDKVKGRLDIFQWKAKSIIHVCDDDFKVIDKCRFGQLYFMKDDKKIEYVPKEESENIISTCGISSELIIDLK